MRRAVRRLCRAGEHRARRIRVAGALQSRTRTAPRTDDRYNNGRSDINGRFPGLRAPDQRSDHAAQFVGRPRVHAGVACCAIWILLGGVTGKSSARTTAGIEETSKETHRNPAAVVCVLHIVGIRDTSMHLRIAGLLMCGAIALAAEDTPKYTVDPGTKIPLNLINSVSTKNASEG